VEIHITYACNFIIAEDELKINDIIVILYKLMKDTLKVISEQLYRQLENAFYVKHIGHFQQVKKKIVSRKLPFRCPQCGEEEHFSYHGFFSKPRRLQIRLGKIFLPARRIKCGDATIISHLFFNFLE